MRFIPLLSLFACAVAPESTPLAPSAPPVSLTVRPALTAGEFVTFTVSGADPHDLVLLARGTGLAPSACPPVLLGACLDITGAQPLQTGIADANGEWSWTVRVPDSIPTGTVVTFQAFAVGTQGTATIPTFRRVEGPERECSDGLDEDDDGRIDCNDDDCASVFVCMQCTTDAAEPNDGPEDATLLPNGLTQAIACEQNDDWYRFDAEVDDRIELQISGGAVDFDVHYPDGTVWSGSGGMHWAHYATHAGEYRIRLRGQSDLDGYDYEIDFRNVPAGTCTDDGLDNDTPWEAASIQPQVPFDAISCGGRWDYYTVDLTGGTTWYASTEVVSSEITTRIISASTWATLGTSIDDLTASYTPPTDERVIVVVVSSADAALEGVDYSVLVSTSQP